VSGFSRTGQTGASSTEGPQSTYSLGRDASGAATLARGAAYACDVGAGVAHVGEVLCGQLAGQRHEQPGIVRAFDPLGQRLQRHQHAQAWAVLVRRVEEHSHSAGTCCHFREAGRSEAPDAIRVGVCDCHHASVAARTRPTDSRRQKRGDARTVHNPGKSDLYQHRPGIGHHGRCALDLRFVVDVAEGGRDGPRPGAYRVNRAKDVR